jgi:hypothetical protein
MPRIGAAWLDQFGWTSLGAGVDEQKEAAQG